MKRIQASRILLIIDGRCLCKTSQIYEATELYWEMQLKHVYMLSRHLNYVTLIHWVALSLSNTHVINFKVGTVSPTVNISCVVRKDGNMSDETLGRSEEQRNQGFVDAEDYFKEACEIFQREVARLRQEQEAFDSMSKKLDHVHFSSTVDLNVGGHHFSTSVQTLTKDPNSMLAAMFSGRFEMKPSKDGSFFIDRDGTHFRFILNYLRTGKLTLPEGATFLKELEEEAEFYQSQGIIDELRSSEPTVQASKPTEAFEESEILTNDAHRSVLKSWLPRGKWRVLFRASRDGFAAATFHSECDNKGPTVTIVKSGNNIFGGFTEVSWASKFADRF